MSKTIMLSYDFQSLPAFLIIPSININFRCPLVVSVFLLIFDIGLHQPATT